ncbi:hypothetical protein AVEN_52289-1 [Araneus ventricosus]|uniref:DNA helicase Pif1-like 2B domain-containing protein n=1 Tax=Araneus ventricosus TaxID=182803 RepID=A0A4Y2W4V9_ARAVE|nr:hypothetical protein AVEN_52289-1 [Araneus ventricosus]
MGPSYSVELFKILELSGAPSDKPRMIVGVPVLLIRNLDIPRLRNGTRLKITHLGTNVVKATVMTDIGKRKCFNSTTSDNTEGFIISVQKVTNPCKNIICEAQGQTLKVAGVHFEKPYFSHVQLYVACSRVYSPHNLYFRANNVVYKSISS